MKAASSLASCSLKEKELIKRVYYNPMISRPALLKDSSLKIATLYRIIESLIKKKILVTSTAFADQELLGRPSELLVLNGSFCYTTSILLFRTHCRIGILNFRGQLMVSEHFSIKEIESADEFFQRVSQLTDKLLEQLSLTQDDLLGVSVSTVGRIDSREGYISKLTYSSKSFLDHLPLKKIITQTFHKPVIVNNIVASAALGMNLTQGEDEALGYILINEGIGSNVVLGNHSPLSCTKFTNGLGHMIVELGGRKCDCGSYGCLETYCASEAIISDVKTSIKLGNPSILTPDVDTLTFSQICQAVELGDDVAVRTIKNAALILVIGLKNFLNILPVNTIVFGGNVVTECPMFLNEVKTALASQSFTNKILVDMNLEHSVFLGAHTELLNAVLDGETLLV